MFVRSMIVFPGIVALLLAAPGCSSNPTDPRDGDDGVSNPMCVPRDPPAVEDIPFPLDGFDYKKALAAQSGERGATRKPKPLRSHGWNLLAAINKPSAGNPAIPVWRTWATAFPAFRPYPSSPDPGTVGAPRATPASRRASQSTLLQMNRENAVLPTSPGATDPPRAPNPGATTEPPVNVLPVPLYQVPEIVCKKYGYPLGTGTNQCPGPPDPKTAFSIPQGDLFQNNGDIMLVTVAYNPPAYSWIRQQKLYSANDLDTAKASGARAIAEFPDGSTVLKHMYWPVARDGYTALPLWTNPTGFAPDAYLGYETWTTAVAVRGQDAPGASVKDVSYLYGVDRWVPGHMTPAAPLRRWFGDAPVVELDAFNYQTLDKNDLAALCVNDRAILDQSAVWAYGRPFKPGDSLVQMAVHIIVKEMPNELSQSGWTFQTFWWANAEPRGGQFGALRPDTVKPGYYMMVDDGLEDPRKAGYWAAHYNPFIEPVIHPVQTSCQNCHARAAWPSKAHYQQVHGKDSGRAGTDYGAYQLSPISNDPGLLRAIYPGDSINASLITTDYQWSVVDRAN